MIDSRIIGVRVRCMLVVSVLALALAGCGSMTAPSQSRTVAGPDRTSTVYGQIVLYHAVPNRAAELKRVLNDRAFVRRLSAEPSFINERVLEPIDDYSLMYITYTKFSDRRAAGDYLSKRLDSVRGLVRRPPEHHLAKLDAAYSPKGVIEDPNGKEFGLGRTGQNAHLGLFVPQSDYLSEYFKAIDQVKRLHVDRKPAGWLGDDLLSTEATVAPAAIAPDSPRPRHATRLSLNYGEYDSFREAEDAYLNRQSSRNPDLIALQNVFYGTLQVPSRYYIMKVLGNYQ